MTFEGPWKSLKSPWISISKDSGKPGNPQPQFVYSLYNFYGATMTIKGSSLSGVPIVSDFQSKIF